MYSSLFVGASWRDIPFNLIVKIFKISSQISRCRRNSLSILTALNEALCYGNTLEILDNNISIIVMYAVGALYSVTEPSAKAIRSILLKDHSRIRNISVPLGTYI